MIYQYQMLKRILFIFAALKTKGFQWHSYVFEEIEECRKAQHVEEHKEVFLNKILNYLRSFFSLDSFADYEEPDAEGVCRTSMLKIAHDHFSDFNSSEETLEQILNYAHQWQTLYNSFLPVGAVVLALFTFYIVYSWRKTAIGALKEVENLETLHRIQEEDWKRSLSVSESTIEQLLEENGSIKTQTINVANKLAATKEEINQLKEKEEQMADDNKKLENQNTKLEMEVIRVHDLLNNEKKNLKTQQNSIESLKNSIEELKKENTTFRSEAKNLTNMLHAARTEIEQQQKQILQKDLHQKQLSQELNHQKIQLKNEATHIQEILQRECELKQKVEHLKALLKTQDEDYKRTLNASKSTIKQLKAENNNIKTEINNLADKLDAARTEIRRQEIQIKNSQRNQEAHLKKAKEQDELNAKLQAHKLLVDGLFFFNENKMDKALVKLNLSIQQHPLGAAHMTRAKVYKALGSFEEALQDSLQAQTLEYTNVNHYLFTAKLYTAIGKPKKALNTLSYLRDNLGMTLAQLGNSFQKLFEKATQLQIYIDKALQSTGEKALHLWERALALAPDSSYLKLKAAQGFLLSDRLDLAKELVEEVCEDETQNADALYLLGCIYFYMGEHQQATDIFHHMSMNGNEKAKKASLILQQSLLYQEGENHMEKEHFEKAFSSFCEALEMGLIDERYYKNLLYARAVVSVILEDHQTAAEDTSAILDMDNKHLPAWIARILCSVALGHYHQASSDIENIATSLEKDFVENTRHLLEIATTGDYYAVLGLDKDCTDDDIKKAFRKTALLHHPDKHSHASEAVRIHHEEKMKMITTAYRILADKTEKLAYDRQQEKLSGYSVRWQNNLATWIIEGYFAHHAGNSYTLNLPL